MDGSLDDLPRVKASPQLTTSREQPVHSPQLEGPGVAYDALVLDAHLQQSLATVRSLGSKGLRVAAMGTSSSDCIPTFSSRWCQQALLCPAEEGSEEYLPYLEQALNCTGARVLITSSDATIALIRRHRERLERRVRIALANEPALGIAVSKERTLAVARRLGLRVPHSVSVGTIGEVATALHEVGLPAVVKPVESWGWNEQQGMRLRYEVVTNLDEARQAVENLTRFGGTTLFQQFIPGRRESVSFVYARGKIYARFSQRHLHVTSGHSCLRRSIAVPPDIGDQAERLIREIELEGCSEVEFRRDHAENAYLMEVNSRLWLSTDHAIRSGVDFPYLLYQWANGEEMEAMTSYRAGVWQRYLSGDITATKNALRQRGRPGIPSPTRTILDFCTAFFLPTRFDYLDWRDPLPALKATTSYLRNVPKKVRRSLWSR